MKIQFEMVWVSKGWHAAIFMLTLESRCIPVVWGGVLVSRTRLITKKPKQLHKTNMLSTQPTTHADTHGQQSLPVSPTPILTPPDLYSAELHFTAAGCKNLDPPLYLFPVHIPMLIRAFVREVVICLEELVPGKRNPTSGLPLHEVQDFRRPKRPDHSSGSEVGNAEN